MGSDFDLLTAEEYRTNCQLTLEPNEECLAILLKNNQKGRFHQVLFRGNEFIISNRKPQQLCLLLRNMSSTNEFKIKTGCKLKRILNKSIIQYKLCHIPQKDLFRAEIVLKNYETNTSDTESDVYKSDTDYK